jgi:hypothetical protein
LAEHADTTEAQRLELRSQVWLLTYNDRNLELGTELPATLRLRPPQRDNPFPSFRGMMICGFCCLGWGTGLLLAGLDLAVWDRPQGSRVALVGASILLPSSFALLTTGRLLHRTHRRWDDRFDASTYLSPSDP